MRQSETKTKEDIASLREQIDSVDNEIIELLLKRIGLSNLVMQSKTSTQIVDPSREQAIVSRYSEKLSEVSTPMKSKRLVAGILGASRLYPES